MKEELIDKYINSQDAFNKYLVEEYKKGNIISYSDYIKTDEAKETAIPKEDIEYYKNMCEKRK